MAPKEPGFWDLVWEFLDEKNQAKGSVECEECGNTRAKIMFHCACETLVTGCAICFSKSARRDEFVRLYVEHTRTCEEFQNLYRRGQI